MYYILKRHNNNVHIYYFLATLYNKLDEVGIAPDIWATSSVTLVYKGGEKEDATCFRMIALPSCLAKPYHINKAERHGLAFPLGSKE